MKTITSPKFSFKGFDWKTFILGFKKPFVVLVTFGIGTIAKYPEYAPIIATLGGSAVIIERVWATIEYFIKEYK